MQITGFSLIPIGSIITVSMRIWISSNPLFNIYVKIDKKSQIGNPIIYGQSPTTSAVNP
jgi:hypothetical protein